MLVQIATPVCAAAMALSLSVEAGSFFHASPSATAQSEAAGTADALADPVDHADEARSSVE